MEVHYLPPLHRNSKPAKEYFIEFIFIFLAVILGFLANHDWESFQVKQKSTEYAQSLFDDLNVDTTIINRTIDEKAWIEERFDSVESILASKSLEENNEFIYYIERYLSINNLFITQDLTFQQLRTTGNSQYINDINLNKKITNYYNLYNQYKANEISYASIEKNDLNTIESKLFNPRDLTSLDNSKAHDFYSLSSLSEIELKPIRKDFDNLKLFYIKVDNAKKHANSTKVLLGRLKDNARDLMKDLKKEYNLK